MGNSHCKVLWFTYLREIMSIIHNVLENIFNDGCSGQPRQPSYMSFYILIYLSIDRCPHILLSIISAHTSLSPSVNGIGKSSIPSRHDMECVNCLRYL